MILFNSDLLNILRVQEIDVHNLDNAEQRKRISTGLMKCRIYLIILVIAISVSNGCKKDVYYNVPNQFKPIYKGGDTLIYSNGILNDTNIIYNISVLDKCEDKKYHYQTIMYSAYNLYNNKKDYDYYTFSLISDQVGLYINHFSAILFYNNTNSFALSINGKNYEQVFKIETLYPDTISKSVKTVYYSYKYAIIRYVNNSNDTFDLINVK
jgi:hypothetical protein